MGLFLKWDIYTNPLLVLLFKEYARSLHSTLFQNPAGVPQWHRWHRPNRWQIWPRNKLWHRWQIRNTFIWFCLLFFAFLCFNIPYVLSFTGYIQTFIKWYVINFFITFINFIYILCRKVNSHTKFFANLRMESLWDYFWNETFIQIGIVGIIWLCGNVWTGWNRLLWWWGEGRNWLKGKGSVIK